MVKYVKEQLEQKKKLVWGTDQPPPYAAQMPPVEELEQAASFGQQEKGELPDELEDLPEAYWRGLSLPQGEARKRLSGLHEQIVKILTDAEKEEGKQCGEMGDGAKAREEEAFDLFDSREYSLNPPIVASKVSTPRRNEEEEEERYDHGGAKPKPPHVTIRKKGVQSSPQARRGDHSSSERECGSVDAVITFNTSGESGHPTGAADASSYPLLAKGAQLQYVPWPTMDLEGLVQRLHCLQDGAGKWIAAFEEETIATILAMGDIKALLGKILGKQEMEEALRAAQLEEFAGT
uniref:uncharacterized protein LOC109953091 n=1 Tax=Monopterus albus TaxID=43700 RepID=UPI0009B3EF02|nr:uncharacterized protein LOC109953091 [Monopterus albus]